MIKLKSLRYLTIALLSVVFIFIFFTSIFFNVFQKTSENILASAAGVENLSYHRINGNLMTGFSVENLFISDDKYTLKSIRSEFRIYLSDIFNNFSNIDLISFKDSQLRLKNYMDQESEEEIISNVSVNRITFDNLNVLLDDNSFFFNYLEINKSKEKGYNVKGNAEAMSSRLRF